ncbi:hypothetical protein BT96DRAFT_999018 [Gymnopus androsaceus JB14]|uniref:Uncharacterized protein n=1 Tax=Gymnopus androsaceus JB14 TaxID=1447944 RepID=A0A6A4H9S7_9AGAR|nr:hypothetical protein BT96DRAFT_999018 [Gymnopus androsaceus JB14]
MSFVKILLLYSVLPRVAGVGAVPAPASTVTVYEGRLSRRFLATSTPSPLGDLSIRSDLVAE